MGDRWFKTSLWFDAVLVNHNTGPADGEGSFFLCPNAMDADVLDNSRYFECPICLQDFSVVDPTTLPCGHSCCLEDARALKKCHMCGAAIPSSTALFVNIMMRDIARRFRPSTAKQDLPKNFETGNGEVSAAVAVLNVVPVNRLPIAEVVAMPSDDASEYSESVVALSDVSAKSKKKKRAKSKKGSATSVSSDMSMDDDVSVSASVCSSLPEIESFSTPGVNLHLSKLCNFTIRSYPSPLSSSSGSGSGSGGSLVTNLELCFASIKVLSLLVAAYIKNSNITPRLVLGGQDLDEGLLIELTGIKVSPLSLIAEGCLHSPTLPEAGRKLFPLLTVSYAHCSFAETTRSADEAFYREVTSAPHTPYAASLVEIHLLKNLLRSNRTKLCSEYIHQHASQQRAGSLLKPSFLVPTDESIAMGSAARVQPFSVKSCCSVVGCDNEGTMTCSRCKTAFYCSKDHQLAHWKAAHRQECGTTAVAAVAATPGPSSSGSSNTTSGSHAADLLSYVTSIPKMFNASG